MVYTHICIYIYKIYLHGKKPSKLANLLMEKPGN